MRRIMRAAGLAASLLCTSTAGAGDAETPRHWQVATAFATQLPAVGAPLKWVAERVTTMTGGELRIDIAQPGDTLPPFGILEAVGSGEVTAGYTWIGYDAETVPAAALFAGFPFSMRARAFVAWYHFKGGHELLQAAFANKGYKIHAELCGITGPEAAGWYRDPIESLQDYEGLEVRFAGLAGAVLKRLGASVTLLPWQQLYQALYRGEIDAAEFSVPVTDKKLGLYELVKYTLLPGWHQPFAAQYLLIGGDAWAALPKRQRVSIQVACLAATTYALAQSEANNGEALERFRQNGVTIGRIPVSVLRELKTVTEDILQERAAEDADFERVLAAQRAFMQSYRSWETRAYLPAELD